MELLHGRENDGPATEPDDPGLRAAIAVLPYPRPSRDLVAGAMAAAERRTIAWPRILKVAAAAAILVGGSVLLHQQVQPEDNAVQTALQLPELAPEEAAPLAPQLLATRRHIALTRQRLLPEPIDQPALDSIDLDSRMRRARQRLRAIRSRNPDLPEENSNTDNGAMRQRGVRDERNKVDCRLLAARCSRGAARLRG